MELKILQKKYPKFVYEKFSYKISDKKLEIFFDFLVEPDLKFRPKIVIENIDKKRLVKIGDKVLNNLVFHLGLMEIPSYWKATCSPEIEIRAGFLNPEQIRWWKDLIIQGMGQFFYENKIDWRLPNFLTIKTNQLSKSDSDRFRGELKNRYMVPIGGGKDSIVTLELLKRKNKEINGFLVNPTSAAKKVVRVAGIKNPIIIKRIIDPALLKLNQRGFLNGHTPFTAVLSFLSVFGAVLFDYKNIVFSNEKSANEGNVNYLRKIINHQWSKSFDFEQKFREYCRKYLTSGVEYFSFLRPLYEIQIAKLFSRYPKYFPAFLSCNIAYQTASGTKKPVKKWCGNCPKCLFVFTTLYPFVEKEELIKIFSKDLFEERELLPIMQELIGERKFKPFECVGTKRECLIAFYLSRKKASKTGELPFLLKYFQNKIFPVFIRSHKKLKQFKGKLKRVLNSWNNQHHLPASLDKILKDAML